MNLVIGWDIMVSSGGFGTDSHLVKCHRIPIKGYKDTSATSTIFWKEHYALEVDQVYSTESN